LNFDNALKRIESDRRFLRNRPNDADGKLFIDGLSISPHQFSPLVEYSGGFKKKGAARSRFAAG